MERFPKLERDVVFNFIFPTAFSMNSGHKNAQCIAAFPLCVYMYTELLFPTLCNPMDCSPPGSCSWDFPGKNTGVGCHFLLQEIFLTQGSDSHLLHLLHWQVDSLPLSYLGSPDFSPITSKSATFHWDSSLDSEVRK